MLIAEQFIPNPDNLPNVDHMNKTRTDNRLENLLWVTDTGNSKNRTSYRGHVQEYFDNIDKDKAIEFNHFNNHEYVDYFYFEETDEFYAYNVAGYRLLNVIYTKERYPFVNAKNTNNKQAHIF